MFRLKIRKGLFLYLIVSGENKMQQNNLDFKKMNGLLPAVIQDVETQGVLMLGFMNKEALEKTIESSRVTFWSRTRQKLWTKGETSGNFLVVQKILLDCDFDTILVQAKPKGPICHKGTKSCFVETLI